MSESPYTESELEEQEKVLKSTIWKVFMPILFATLILAYIFSFYDKPENNTGEQIEIKGTITYLSSEIDICNRCPNYIYINNKTPVVTNYAIFLKLEIGDSVFKDKNSDTILYIKKSGKIIKSLFITHN